MVSLALTPPYSLFDGVDYTDKNLPSSERYKWVEYHKWKLKGEWYTTLSRGSQRSLVLMAKAEMGYLGSYNKNKISPFEGFDVGGDGMSGYNVYGVDVIALRGYDNGSLTPLAANGDYARVYNKYTVELRYPIIMSAQAQAYALAFAEGGNAFTDWKKFNPFQIKRSLGFGVRLYLPIVGLIGVDYGYGFDPAPGETKRHGGQLHYLIGAQQQF
jgi:outer membrane protein insertion porin family